MLQQQADAEIRKLIDAAGVTSFRELLLLGEIGEVSPTSRNPHVRLALVGMVFWAVGWLLHNQGLSRLEKF